MSHDSYNTITVGRVEINAPQSMQRNREGTVAISGTSVYTSKAAADAARQQLLGHRTEVVPVGADDFDDQLTGFYRMESAAVTSVPGRLGDTFAYSITLWQLGDGYANATVEEFSTVADWPNTGPGGSDYGIWTMPEGPDTIWSWTQPAGGGFNFATETGAIESIAVDISAATSYGRPPWANQFRLADPLDLYRGSARLELFNGEEWYTATGKRIPPTSLSAVRISNGIVRLLFFPSDTSVTVGSSGGYVVLQRWVSGSGWGTSHVWWPYDATTLFFKDQLIDVVKNTPSMVQIRVPFAKGPGGGQDDVGVLGSAMFSIERGRRHIQLIDPVDGSGAPWSNIFTLDYDGLASTVYDGTNYPVLEIADAADADGNKLVMWGPTSVVDGYITPAVGEPVRIGLATAAELTPATPDPKAHFAREMTIGSTNQLRVVT